MRSDMKKAVSGAKNYRSALKIGNMAYLLVITLFSGGPSECPSYPFGSPCHGLPGPTVVHFRSSRPPLHWSLRWSLRRIGLSAQHPGGRREFREQGASMKITIVTRIPVTGMIIVICRIETSAILFSSLYFRNYAKWNHHFLHLLTRIIPRRW
jgi:hypothetical protein